MRGSNVVTVAVQTRELGVRPVVFLMLFTGRADSEGYLWLEPSGLETSSSDPCASHPLFSLDPSVMPAQINLSLILRPLEITMLFVFPIPWI